MPRQDIIEKREETRWGEIRSVSPLEITDMSRRSGSADGDAETATISRERTRLEPPNKYNVIMHNDDYTPMNFVVEVLVNIFQKSYDDATELMMYIHTHGDGIVGTYPKSIAEMKVLKTRDVAEKAHCDEFKITMEKAD